MVWKKRRAGLVLLSVGRKNVAPAFVLYLRGLVNPLEIAYAHVGPQLCPPLPPLHYGNLYHRVLTQLIGYGLRLSFP